MSLPLTSPESTGAPRVRLRAAVIATITMALLALGAERSVRHAYPDLDLPGPVIPTLPDGPVPARTPVHRVMLVVLDGLRADVAHTLPTVSTVARRGINATLWHDPPTYSSAQYVSLLTGVPPRDSGVRTNVSLHRTGLDSVARRVRASGRASVEVGDCVDWWARLFGEDFSSAERVHPADLVPAVARRMSDADLLVVHLCGVDDAGHAAGGDSETYRAAARTADATLATLLRLWDWPSRAVMVVADHGHMPAGGHGGDEIDVRATWMVAAGTGIPTRGALPDARAIDVAPTLAALLGVAGPAQSEGRVIPGVIDGDAETLAAIARDDAARVARVERAAEPVRARWRAQESRARIVRGVLAAMVFLLAIRWAFRRGGAARRGLTIGAASSLLWCAVFPLAMGGVSFSAAKDAHPLMISSAGISAVCTVIMAWAIERRASAPRADVLAPCWLGVGWITGGSLPALAGFALGGAFAPRFACEPAWLAAAPALGYSQVFPLALLGAIMGAVAVGRAYRSASAS